MLTRSATAKIVNQYTKQSNRTYQYDKSSSLSLNYNNKTNDNSGENDNVLESNYHYYTRFTSRKKNVLSDITNTCYAEKNQEKNMASKLHTMTNDYSSHKIQSKKSKFREKNFEDQQQKSPLNESKKLKLTKDNNMKSSICEQEAYFNIGKIEPLTKMTYSKEYDKMNSNQLKEKQPRELNQTKSEKQNECFQLERVQIQLRDTIKQGIEITTEQKTCHKKKVNLKKNKEVIQKLALNDTASKKENDILDKNTNLINGEAINQTPNSKSIMDSSIKTNIKISPQRSLVLNNEQPESLKTQIKCIDFKNNNENEVNSPISQSIFSKHQVLTRFLTSSIQNKKNKVSKRLFGPEDSFVRIKQDTLNTPKPNLISREIRRQKLQNAPRAIRKKAKKIIAKDNIDSCPTPLWKDFKEDIQVNTNEVTNDNDIDPLFHEIFDSLI